MAVESVAKERPGCSMDGVKVEIPGVDVQGMLKPENLFDALAAVLSVKFDKEITVKTRPPAWMERAAQEGAGHDAEKVLSRRLPPDKENGGGAGRARVRDGAGVGA